MSGAARLRAVLATAALAACRLIALDAATGCPCAGFGTGGTVDLQRDLINLPFEPGEYQAEEIGAVALRRPAVVR